MLLAHYDATSQSKQTLNEHLLNVANECQKRGGIINQGSVMFLIGLFHDLGKADSLFQNMILNQTKEKINHSSFGARYICEYAFKHIHLFNCEHDVDRLQALNSSHSVRVRGLK